MNIKTADITEEAKKIAEYEELGIDPEKITLRRVGKILSALRLSKVEKRERNAGRGWKITTQDVQRLKVA